MNTPRSSIRFLAENNHIKVYSIYEHVYLKYKETSNNQKEFSEEDIFITNHYGDPTGAIILNSGKHIIVSGCGLTIYSIEDGVEKHIMDDPDHIVWTNGLFQDGLDDQSIEFRFVRYNQNDMLRVYKMNIQTMEQIELE